METCENCSSLIFEKYGSGRFCSKKCAKAFSTKNRRQEINDKVSKKLKNPTLVTCKYCREIFQTNRRKVFCNRSCQAKYVWLNNETRAQLTELSRNRAIKRHNEGDPTIGWISRKKLQPSFPESVFISLLNEYNVEFEREKKVGKYFIDFAIKNIALEIDGRHHEEENVKLKDKQKDLYLEENGWIVVRIKWKNLQSARKQFIDFLKNAQVA